MIIWFEHCPRALPLDCSNQIITESSESIWHWINKEHIHPVQKAGSEASQTEQGSDSRIGVVTPMFLSQTKRHFSNKVKPASRRCTQTQWVGLSRRPSVEIFQFSRQHARERIRCQSVRRNGLTLSWFGWLLCRICAVRNGNSVVFLWTDLA